MEPPSDKPGRQPRLPPQGSCVFPHFVVLAIVLVFAAIGFSDGLHVSLRAAFSSAFVLVVVSIPLIVVFLIVYFGITWFTDNRR